MKIKTKFFLFSALSILLGLIVIGTIFYAMNKSSNIPDTLSAFQAAIHDQSLRSKTSYEVKAELWKGISACQHKEQGSLENAIKKIKKTLESYNRNKISGIPFNLSSVVDNNIRKSNELFQNAVESSLLLTNKFNQPNITDDLKEIDKEFNEVNKINDLLYYQIVDLRNDLRKDARFIIRQVIVTSSAVAAFVIILICIISTLANYKIFKPLERIIRIMKHVEKGTWKDEIPYASRSDEIGDIALALKIFNKNNEIKRLLEKNTKELEIKIEKDKHNHMAEFANQLETSIKEISDAVALTANKIDRTAKNLSDQATSIKKETTQLAAYSLKTNNNIQEVSKSSATFIDASHKLTKQVNNAQKYTEQTSKQTSHMNKLIKNLENNAEAISSIIDFINHITSQIELLALNASIEASRAGEFGKGFAVVASEVKGLVTQTTKATEQVTTQISSIQGSTKEAVDAIKDIIISIGTINETSSSISTVIEEQNKSTTIIVSKVTQIAEMSDSINSNIDKVAQSSTDSRESASKMLSEAEDLSAQASTLKNKVDSLLISLKNG